MKKLFVAAAMAIVLGAAGSASASKADVWKDSAFDLRRLHSLAVGAVELPQDMENDRAAELAFKFAAEESAKKLTKMDFVYDESKADGVVVVKIEEFALGERWQKPYCTTESHTDSSDYRHKDKDGKEYVETITRRWTEPVLHTAGWRFDPYAAATLTIVERQSGREVMKFYERVEKNKRIDAVYSIMEDFYKEVNKAAK